jgi:hypothetical protein
MCLPVSRLFLVSSLAYPNLLGTKDYVVVVVAGCGLYIPQACLLRVHSIWVSAFVAVTISSLVHVLYLSETGLTVLFNFIASKKDTLR